MFLDFDFGNSYKQYFKNLKNIFTFVFKHSFLDFFMGV